MKWFILFAVVVVSGCSGEAPKQSNARDNIVCLQGVQYYKFAVMSGNQGYGYLAPVYSDKTMKVKLCKGGF